MTLARALGFTHRPTGIPNQDPPRTRLWRVRGTLDVDLEVYATTPGDAARQARDALGDVAGRVDAIPGVWAAGGELDDPEEAR